MNTYRKWLKVVGISLFMVLQWIGNQYYRELLTWQLVRQNILMLVLVIFQWYLVEYVIDLFRLKFGAYKHNVLRAFLTITICGIGGMVLSYVLFHISEIMSPNRPLDLIVPLKYLGIMFVASAFLYGADEVFFTYYQMALLQKEKAALQKANLQGQLELLKNQANPHFLFDGLKTLVELIPVSPSKAEAFGEALTAVYDYLSKDNENGSTSLMQEMAFTNSYFHLLKTKYGEGLDLKVNIPERFMPYHLLPLTLQLLIENAVKHNIISETQPLLIEVLIEKSTLRKKTPYLAVRNNLQRKTGEVQPSQSGLVNMMNKYELLDRGEVAIQESEGYFAVTLPLINPKYLATK